MADPVRKEETYTYEDFLHWPADERWELIDGHAFAMSPAPLFRHQKAVGSIYAQLFAQLQGKPCQVMVAPLDVRLTEKGLNQEDITHVVQPDILIFCDPAKADEKGLIAAPDWILEVLSDHTAWKDQTVKLTLYERFGVKEYWVYNPETKLLLIHTLEGSRYPAPQAILGPATVSVTTLPNLTVNID